ncbi:MAG: hypothetical protein IPM16_02250 [Chloroflexi bacterium]|nr:hypothetical protein [Chloroflexota bacterium]
MMDPQPANVTPDVGPDAARLRVLSGQRRRVWLLFLAGFAVFATVLTAVVAAAGPHIGVLANLVAITVCLVPLLLVSFAVMIGTAAAIWGVGRLDAAAVRQTARAENAAADLAERTRDVARAGGSRLIGLSAAVERLAPLWNIFDSEETKGDGDGAKRAADDTPAHP